MEKQGVIIKKSFENLSEKLVKSAKFTDEYFSEVVFWKHLANCFLVVFYFFFLLVLFFLSLSFSKAAYLQKYSYSANKARAEQRQAQVL